MYKPENKQRSFYDEVYENAVPENHFLRRLDEIVGWERLEKRFRKHYKKFGRDAHNPVMMFKLLILQFLYDLSDRQLEESARDRISFRWFCRIDPVGCPPDYSSFCRFRDRIGPETIKKLFEDIVADASSCGLVVDKLSIVDSTDIKAKVDIFKNDPPGGFSGGPDPDARFGKKSDKKTIHGYKAHMAIDDGSEIITKVEVSPADVHDGKFFPSVHDECAQSVTADRAYDSEENFSRIRDCGQRPAIIVKKKRGKKRGHIAGRYDDFELSHYYRMKRRRPRIEHKFAEAKLYHGLSRARYLGLAKVRIQVFLTALALNLKRIIHLFYGEARWEMV